MHSSASLADKLTFRYSPLLDLALSWLVLDNPERFGPQPWIKTYLNDWPREGDWPKFQADLREVDLFALALELDGDGPGTTEERLAAYAAREPAAGQALLAYWRQLAPYLAGHMGEVTASLQEEQARLAAMDPAAYLSGFSDRLRLVGDGEAIILHWGKGMRVPLQDLTRIILVPSVFCPRRLMFYRVGKTQIFFFPVQRVPTEPLSAEPPESLLLGFGALADPTRLKLLRLIALRRMPAQDMARHLELSESTVSRHLRLLVEAGLVAREGQAGRYIYYRYQEGRIGGLAARATEYLLGGS